MTKLLPNFICPGAQKSATTTLYDILKQHPDIYLPECKEAHFFDKEKNFAKGLDWYSKKYFSNSAGAKAIGEITPIYMYYEVIPERLYNSLGPNLKLIFMLRNPVDRAYSHYLMIRKMGIERLSFKKAIKVESGRIKKSDYNHRHFSYLDRGFYAKQIERFLRYFPKEQMLFILFEEFIKDPKSSIINICTFLGVDFRTDLDCDLISNRAPLFEYSLWQSFLARLQQRLFSERKKVLPGFIGKEIKRLIEISKMKPVKELELMEKQELAELFLTDKLILQDLIEKDLNIWF